MIKKKKRKIESSKVSPTPKHGGPGQSARGGPDLFLMVVKAAAMAFLLSVNRVPLAVLKQILHTTPSLLDLETLGVRRR